MEPSEIAVQVFGGDAAACAQEAIDLAVPAFCRLDVQRASEPLAGRGIDADQLRAWVLSGIERGLEPATTNVTVAALKFLYADTLGCPGPCHAAHPRRGVPLQCVEGPAQRVGVTWCRSAVSFSCGFLVAACRIRSAAWVTLSRLCVRRVLSRRGFPLVEALPSTDSAGARAPLFARFAGSMAPSDFFTPCISGFGYLLPFAAPARLPGQSEDLPGPGGGRTCVPGVSDAAKPFHTSPLHGAVGVAFDAFDRLGASDNLSFGAQYPCPRAALPTLHHRPHGRQCTARGETRSATPFVSRDFHPLPFHQFAWRSRCVGFRTPGTTWWERLVGNRPT